jgi:AraC family transcriptional activator of pobA
MKDKHIHRFTSISEFHAMSSLPKPEHPLVSLVDYAQVNYHTNESEICWVQDFFTIGFKRDIQGKFKYDAFTNVNL